MRWIITPRRWRRYQIRRAADVRQVGKRVIARLHGHDDGLDTEDPVVVLMAGEIGAADLLERVGTVAAAHRRAPDGAGRVIRDDGHVVALERAALGAFSTSKPCAHKTRRPPSAAALAEAARLRGLPATGPAAHVVIDLSAYAATAARLDSAPTYESQPESEED